MAAYCHLRGQQQLLPFLAFALMILTSKASPKHNTRTLKPIYRTNNLALIPLLGKSLGVDITCAAEEQENKIPDSQKDVHCRAKIGAQKSAKHETAYRVDCVT